MVSGLQINTPVVYIAEASFSPSSFVAEDVEARCHIWWRTQARGFLSREMINEETLPSSFSRIISLVLQTALLPGGLRIHISAYGTSVEMASLLITVAINNHV